MRKLTLNEKNRLLEWTNIQVNITNKIMTFFKIFGGIQMGGLAIAMFTAKMPDIVFMGIGEVILYLIYFKFTSFLSRNNTWVKLTNMVEEGREIVYDSILLETYLAGNGQQGDTKHLKARVLTLFDNKERTCLIPFDLRDTKKGENIALLCFNVGGTGEMYGILADKDVQEEF